MKNALILVSLLFSACASTVGIEIPPQAEEPTAVAPPQEIHAQQPFIFEERGDYISGMPIDIEPLPSGNWLVVTREGHAVLLNFRFAHVSHDTIPTETFGDSGLFSMALDPEFETNNFVYLYRTTLQETAPCGTSYCSEVTRYEVDEIGPTLLNNPVTIAVFPSFNFEGLHFGGAMVFGPDGMLYLGTGDGENSDTMHRQFAQDVDSHLGKILRIDTETLEVEIVAIGLRNPFTGVASPEGVLIGDVGAAFYEEINLFPWNSLEIVNFGWPFEEGPGLEFVSPIHGFKHCDEEFEDADPFGHDQSKTMTTKFHAGVVHECGNEIIAVNTYYKRRGAGDFDPYNGVFDESVIYSDSYYGFLRAFYLSDGKASNDRHFAHFPGIAQMVEGPDGHLYGVSMFASNHVLRLIPNPEAHED